MGAFLSTSTVLDTFLDLQVKLGNGVLLHVKLNRTIGVQTKNGVEYISKLTVS